MVFNCAKLIFMRYITSVFLLLMWSLTCSSAPHFIVVGHADEPVGVYFKPFNYRGPGASPGVAIEEILLSHLSQSNLFFQPWGIQPESQWNLYHWRLAGVRYVISGDIEETDQAIDLRLTVTDTLGTTPTFVWVELNVDAWQQATRVFARQLLHSLFYATYTDTMDSQYLQNTDPIETRYWMSLVKTLKQHWYGQSGHGECLVEITQLPGGRVQAFDFKAECESQLRHEIEALFARLDSLPYGGYKAPFEQNFTVTFVARD